MADTNKVTVYLLKNHKSILKSLEENHDMHELGDGRIFYYDNSEVSKPIWIDGFFNGNLGNLLLLNQSSKGVLIRKIKIGKEEKYFALPFGYGHSMFDKSDCESDFGLKIVLNVVEKIRRVERRTLSSEPRQTIEQLSKIGDISDFGIDIEQDLVEEVTGKPENPIFGKGLVTGRVAFSATVGVDISNLDDYLRECFRYYKKKDYQKRFAFIDRIKEITDTDMWNDLLIKDLQSSKSKFGNEWLTVPDVVNWENVSGFSYTSISDEDPVGDLDLDEFLSVLPKSTKKQMSIDTLKARRIYYIGTDGETESGSWSAFNCLYCEITYQGRTVLLTNGKWYEIDRDFAQEVENAYKDTLAASSALKFIDCKKKENEGEYNKRLTKSVGGILMDKKNISYGGGHSKVELCDVYDQTEKSFIHVKIGQSSSTLSHLFAQGRVSGQLFLYEAQFRDEAKRKNGKLPFTGKSVPRPKDYKIVFGIIEGSKHQLNIPFFSKVNFRDTKRTLNGIGWNEIYLTKIQKLK